MVTESKLNLNHAFISVEEEKNILDEKLHNLIYSNYKIFLDSFRWHQEISEELCAFEKFTAENVVCIDTLKNFIPKLSLDGFCTNEKYKNIKLALIKYPKLIELLEIPQLMDTCLKNGLYEPSLQLYNFIKKLIINYPNLNVLKLIQQDVEKSFEVLLKGLIQRLENESSQLPELIKTVGLIRSVGVFTEHDLRLLFLKSKSRHLRVSIRSLCTRLLETHDSRGTKVTYLFINQICDVFRINLFEAITQYSALFTLGDEIQTNKSVYSIENYVSRREIYNRILDSWLSFELKNMMKVLDYYLNVLFNPTKPDPYFETDFPLAFASLHDQFTYVGTSLSRLNMDLRSILIHKLTERVIEYVPCLFKHVFDRFKANLYQRYNYYCRQPTVSISSKVIKNASSIIDNAVEPKPTIVDESATVDAEATENIENELAKNDTDKSENAEENSLDKKPIEEPLVGHDESAANQLVEVDKIQSFDDGVLVKIQDITSSSVPISNNDNTMLPTSSNHQDHVETLTESDNNENIDSCLLLSSLKNELSKCLESASLLSSDMNAPSSTTTVKVYSFTYPVCLDEYGRVLVECANEIKLFYSKCSQSEKRSLIPVETMMTLYKDTFLPIMVRNIMTVFPKSALDNTMGITVLKPFPMFQTAEEYTEHLLAQITTTL